MREFEPLKTFELIKSQEVNDGEPHPLHHSTELLSRSNSTYFNSLDQAFMQYSKKSTKSNNKMFQNDFNSKTGNKNRSQT